jgi:hypothetical protein
MCRRESELLAGLERPGVGGRFWRGAAWAVGLSAPFWTLLWLAWRWWVGR